MLFSIQLHYFISLPTVHKGSSFSTSSPTLAIFFSFMGGDNIHFNMVEIHKHFKGL